MNKTKIVLILFSAFLFSSTLLAQYGQYEITARIEGAEGVKFQLMERSMGRMVKVDSAVVVDGGFKISGHTVMHPVFVNLVAPEKRKGLSFFVENARITIVGKLDSLNNAKVTGSRTQDEFASLLDLLRPYQEKSANLYKEYQAASLAKDTAKMKAISMEASAMSKETAKVQKNFVEKNPKSFVCPLIISGMATSAPQAEVLAMINSLDPAVGKVLELVDLKKKYEAMKSVEIGQKAPDFTLNDPDGKPVSLYSRVGKNLLLVDFWAAWCGPCRRENPNVVKVYKEFSGKGFDVLGVSLDRTKEDWIKAISDDHLTWTHVSDLQYFSNAAAKLYFINSIPANVLLDKNGIILARNLRGDDLYNKVREILGNK